MNTNDDRIPLRTVPDLRGTVAEDASGLSVGQLWGALSEADTGLLRYLDLQLQRQARHVLVPIGHARLREVEGVATVRLRAALLEDLEAIPAYPAAHPLDETFEHSLLEAHGRAFHGERYYAHPSFDHSGLYAGEHPIVRGASVEPGQSLAPLADLPAYRVARGEPDIRGWSLDGADGTALGTIGDLVVDLAEEKVRYVVLETAGSGRRVLVPVGYLSIDAERGRVGTRALAEADVLALPGYAGGQVDRTDEEAVLAVLRDQLRGGRRYLGPDFNGTGIIRSEQRGA